MSQVGWHARSIFGSWAVNVCQSQNRSIRLYPEQIYLLALSSEEITSKRREERKQFKLDRARAIAAVAAQAEQVFATEGRVIIPTLSGPEIPSSATWRPTRPSRAETSNDTIPLDPIAVEDDSGEVHNEVELNDIEHLQLTFQEAFFLVWNLGCLSIRDPDTVSL